MVITVESLPCILFQCVWYQRILGLCALNLHIPASNSEARNSRLSQRGIKGRRNGPCESFEQTPIMLWLYWSQITPAWYLLDCTRLETAKKIAGMDLVSCQLLEGNLKELFCTTSFWPAFPLLSVFFSIQTSVPSSFLQNSGANKQALSRHEQGNQTAKRRKNKQGLVRFRCDLVEQVSV